MEQQVKSKQRVADHGEVFTNEREVNAMLDMVKQETGRIESRFLEPACGNGNFLAEVLRRKLDVVKQRYGKVLPDYEKYAFVAVSSMYGVELLEDNAHECRQRLFDIVDESYSRIAKDKSNPLFLETIQYVVNKNILCGDALSLKSSDGQPIMFAEWSIGSDDKLKRRDFRLDELLEGNVDKGGTMPSAGKFDDTGEVIPKRFDVIVGNPPYQLRVNEPGKGLGAVPIYQKFVDQALRLKPRYLAMITPARWYSGGVGLDKFRKDMLSNRSLAKIVDFSDSNDCFPGVDINGGVCYFLIDSHFDGDCDYENHTNGEVSYAKRRLDEFDIFIRRNEAVSIIRKVLSRHEKTLAEEGGCSPQTPYGFLSTYRGTDKPSGNNDCEILSSKGWSYVPRSDVRKSTETIDMFKPMISKLSCEHAGNPDKNGMFRVLSRMELLKPGQICTQSYLTVCPCESEAEATNAYNYLRTKFVRFLLLQTLAGMNISISNFKFVPWLDFTRAWTDEDLYGRYDISGEEAEFIDSLIRDMDD